MINIIKKIRVTVVAILWILIFAILLTSCNSSHKRDKLNGALDNIIADFNNFINPPYGDIELSLFKNGDLIFQIDSSSFSNAVIESTSGNFSHVGIIERIADTLYIIDATPKKGVSKQLLVDFITQTPKDSLGIPMIRVKRLNKLQENVSADSLQSIANNAVEHALSLLGKPYDFAFTKGDEKIYCSELIYESFRCNGAPIFSLIPMNFKDSSGEISDFWIDYYQKLNLSVPQGEEGSNPNQIFQSPLLREIAF